MLKKVILQNFFSFAEETTIELNPGLNVLLGINGSGKTNFLHAINLLYEGVAGGGFEKHMISLGGFDEIVNCTKNGVNEIHLTYVFDADVVNKKVNRKVFYNDIYYSITIIKQSTDYILSEKLYSYYNNKSKRYFPYLSFHNGSGSITERTDDKGVVVKKHNQRQEPTQQLFDTGTLSGRELALHNIYDPTRFLPLFAIRKTVEALHIYSRFDLSSDSPLRNPCKPASDLQLSPSGDNIAHIINYFKNNRISVADKIDSQLNEVCPWFKSTRMQLFGDKLYLSLKEEGLERTIGAQHISDGTLKFLLILCIFLNPERGLVVGVDEPESSLHPDMITSLADMMKAASHESQIIAATHSALLLNHFDLDDILVFEKGESNGTTVSRINEEDFDEEELLPGQLWLMGKIGGKRW